MQEISNNPCLVQKPISPKRHFSSYPVPSVLGVAKWNAENQDCESTYEESVNQLHAYHKTWDHAGRELCKVTEYNESMEYSASKEESETTGKMNEFKITNSISEKFPKFSIASLCISECSGHNALAESKRIDMEYTENLEVLIYTENGKDIEEDFLEIKDTCQGTKGSIDGDVFETKFERNERFCGCNSCGIF